MLNKFISEKNLSSKVVTLLSLPVYLRNLPDFYDEIMTNHKFYRDQVKKLDLDNESLSELAVR